MADPVVGAIVVSYGPDSLARSSVRSLARGEVAPDYILVVHNGPSPVGDWPGVRRAESGELGGRGPLHKGVTLVEAGRNLGYSGALRLGVAGLERSGASIDYLWLLNNDVTVHRSALGALLGAAKLAPDVGFWGSTICTDDAFDVVSSVGVRYSPWTTRRRDVLAGVATTGALQLTCSPFIDYVPGAAMFMSADVYRRCGGLSSAYFMYFEELDLAARVRALGLSVGWCRESLVAHAGGATTGSYRKRHQRPPAVAYHAMRSALIYTRRYQPKAVSSVVACRMVAHVGANLVMGNLQSAGAAMRGCIAGLAASLSDEIAS